MSTTAATERYTPEDLLIMPDGKHYELVQGELVERNTGCEASFVAAQLVCLLAAFCRVHRCGWVFDSEASFQCFPDESTRVRKADVSFIRLDRLKQLPRGHCKIAPDFVAEVVSPNDLYSEVEKKVAQYLQAKVRLVWVVDPPTRSVRVHRLDGPPTDLGEHDELSGEQVIPGFRCKVSEIFDLPS